MPTRTPHSSTMPKSIILLLFSLSLCGFPSFTTTVASICTLRRVARKQVAANELPQCSQCYGFLISVMVLSVPHGPCPSPLSCHPSPIPFVCLSFTYMHQPQISQWLVNCTCGEVNGWRYSEVEVQSTCLPPKYPPGPLSSSTWGGHTEYAPRAKEIHCAVWSN